MSDTINLTLNSDLLSAGRTVGEKIIGKVNRHMMPMFFLLSLLCSLDRANLSFAGMDLASSRAVLPCPNFQVTCLRGLLSMHLRPSDAPVCVRAALQLNQDLHFTPRVYGFGSGNPPPLPLFHISLSTEYISLAACSPFPMRLSLIQLFPSCHTVRAAPGTQFDRPSGGFRFQLNPGPQTQTLSPCCCAPAGIFFVGYACLQIPAAVLCARVGAPAFLGCSLAAWGALASSFAAMRTRTQFFVMRFVLGLCEAGAYPGVVPRQQATPLNPKS